MRAKAARAALAATPSDDACTTILTGTPMCTAVNSRRTCASAPEARTIAETPRRSRYARSKFMVVLTHIRDRRFDLPDDIAFGARAGDLHRFRPGHTSPVRNGEGAGHIHLDRSDGGDL